MANSSDVTMVMDYDFVPVPSELLFNAGVSLYFGLTVELLVNCFLLDALTNNNVEERRAGLYILGKDS